MVRIDLDKLYKEHRNGGTYFGGVWVPVSKDADIDTIFHILDKMEYQGHISKSMKAEVMDVLFPKTDQTLLQEWWESRPMIEKRIIIDYKFTDYSWDDLNDVDKELIEIYKNRTSEGKTK